MDHEDLLRDLQVRVVLLGLVAHLGLQAFLDLLGQKVSRVRQGLQVLMVSLVPKGLLDFLVYLGNRACRAYRFHLYQDPVEIQALPASDIPVPQDPSAQDQLDQLDLLALSDLPDQAVLTEQEQLDLLDLPDLLATVQQDPSELLDQLGQVLPGLLALPDLLAKGLSESQVLQEISVHPELLGVLARPVSLGLQAPMDIV